MRLSRRIRWILLGVGAIVVAALVVLRLPPVQRWLVLRLFPSGPGSSLQVEELGAGLRGFHARRLRLNYQGLAVEVEEAEARYRLLDLVAARTIRVDRLHVKGLHVDARAMPRSEAKSPAPPYRFEGLRPLAQLPVRIVVGDLSVHGEVLLPTTEGATMRWNADLAGKNVAPGATGELEARVTMGLETPERKSAVLDGHGKLVLHETAEGLLDRAEFEGEIRPARPDAPEGRGLSAKARIDLTRPEEAYSAILSTLGGSAKEVLRLEARTATGSRRVKGTWIAHLDRGQVDPYLGGFTPPDFALKGDGEIDADLDRRSADLKARFDLSARGWETLHPALAPVGEIRLLGETEAAVSRAAIAVRSLSLGAEDPSGRKILEVTAGQPFSIDLAARRLTPEKWGVPVVRARLDRIPLAWARSLGSQVTVTGGSASGAFDLTWTGPEEIRFAASEPLAADGIMVRKPDGSEMGPFTLRARPQVTLSPARLEATLSGLQAGLPTGARLDFQGSFALPRDGRLQSDLTGELEVRLPKVTSLVPELASMHAKGTFGLDLKQNLLAVRAASFAARSGKGNPLMEGEVTTVQPLEIDLNTMRPEWTRFVPDKLRWRIEGFPIAWVSRFLPEIRLESGRLYGDFRAHVAENQEVLIDSAVPFEIRDASILWHDVVLSKEARLELRPSIRINASEVRTSLDGIRIRGGRGSRVDGTVNLRAVPERRGRIEVDASLRVAAPILTDPIGRLGEFRVEADATLEPAHRTLSVARASFDCRDSEDQSYLAGTSLQPFRIDLESFDIAPGRGSPDLFEAKFTPLELERIFPSALGFALSGPLPSGDALISVQDGGLLFHVVRPIQFGPISVSRSGVPLLDRVEFTLNPEVLYTRQGVRSRSTVLDIAARGRRIAHLESHAAFDVTGRTPERSGEMKLELDLPSLLDQPVGAGLPGFRSGKLTAVLSGTLVPQPASGFEIALDGAVAADNRPVPDLHGTVRLTKSSEETVEMESPWTVKSAGKTSDLTFRGKLNREGKDYRLHLSIDSKRVAVDDLMRIASAFIPPAQTSTPPATTGTPLVPKSASTPDAKSLPPPARRPALRELASHRDEVPFWSGWRGEVPVRFESIEFDRYAITGLSATLEATEDALSVSGVGGECLGARLAGSSELSFAKTKELPYSIRTALSVTGLDMKRIFTAVDPNRKPTVEGQFTVAFTGESTGANPMDLLLRSRAEFKAEGRDGVFRALQEPVGKLSFLAGAAGVLTFSKELRAVGRLLHKLEEAPFSTAIFDLTRDPEAGLQLRSLEVNADTLKVGGSGHIPIQLDVPFVERPLSARMDLAARGDSAIVLDGMGLLVEKPDAAGYRTMTKPFTVTGTVGSPDASELYKILDEAAQNATGSFGWALRKALKTLPKP